MTTEQKADTDHKNTDPLSEAVEHLAAKGEREGWSYTPTDPAYKTFREAIRAELELAEPFFAAHYEQKGAEGERERVREAFLNAGVAPGDGDLNNRWTFLAFVDSTLAVPSGNGGTE